MSELAYTHVVAEKQVATPAVVTPANKPPQNPVPIPLLEKEHSSGDDRLGASADDARLPEPEVSGLHCPKLITNIQRHASEQHPEPSSLRQRLGDALSRTQVDLRALQNEGAPNRSIRRVAQSDSDRPHFSLINRDSFTAGLRTDTMSGTVADVSLVNQPTRVTARVHRSITPAGRSRSGAEPEVGRVGGLLDGAAGDATDGRIGAGRPLDRPVLQRMQDGFAADLSGVRMDTNPSSTVLNRMVSARAFTAGNDLFFGNGGYAPHTRAGDRPIAHELAHTLRRSTVVHGIGGGRTGPPISRVPDANDDEIASKSPTEKLLSAWEAAKPHLAKDAVEQLSGLMTLESLGMMAGFTVAYAVAQATPVGWVADGIALASLGVTAFFEGKVVLDVTRDLLGFAAAVNAHNKNDIERAGAALSHAIAVGGMVLVTELITHAISAPGGGKAGATPSEAPPGYVDALTKDGRIVRAPADAAEHMLDADTASPGLPEQPGPETPSSATPIDSAALPENQGGRQPEQPAATPADAPALETETAAIVAQQQRAEQEFQEFLEWARSEGSTEVVAEGERIEMQAHGAASQVRARYGLSGDHQSMHGLPRSTAKDLPGYDPKASLTTFGKKDLHADLDEPWKQAFQQMRREGKTSVTAQAVYDAVANAINRSKKLAAGVKRSLILRLHDEVFVEYGLSPNQKLRLPYPNIPAAH